MIKHYYIPNYIVKRRKTLSALKCLTVNTPWSCLNAMQIALLYLHAHSCLTFKIANISVSPIYKTQPLLKNSHPTFSSPKEGKENPTKLQNKLKEGKKK